MQIHNVKANDLKATLVFSNEGMGQKKIGYLESIFRAGSEMIFQFQDLSLHYVKGQKTIWVREECLSQIKQVEMLS